MRRNAQWSQCGLSLVVLHDYFLTRHSVKGRKRRREEEGKKRRCFFSSLSLFFCFHTAAAPVRRLRVALLVRVASVG